MVDTIKDYKIFKLVTSELVIAKLLSVDDLGYHVEQPRVLNISYVTNGQAAMSMYLSSLNPLSKNEDYVFKKYHVVIVDDVTDPYIAMYYSDNVKVGGRSSGGSTPEGSPKRTAKEVLSDLVKPEPVEEIRIN